MLLIESSVTSTFVGQNILLTTLFWNTLSLRTFCKVTNHVLHPTPIHIYIYIYKQTESTENFSLYILGQQMEDKGFSTTFCGPRHFTNKLKNGLRVNKKVCTYVPCDYSSTSSTTRPIWTCTDMLETVQTAS